MPVPSVRPARQAATVVAAAAVAAVTAASLSAAPASGAAAVEPPAPTLTAEVVRSGPIVPWDVGFLPDGTMAVTERPGRIRVYSDGSPGATLVRTVVVPSIRVQADNGNTGEAGVMGIAVDTDFASHPYVYVCASRDYTGSGGWFNQVLRYRVGSSGSWSGPTVILSGMRANQNHNGCALEMDDSGHLWVGMGDAQDLGAPQDRSSLNGKILRMTRTGGVPADNPEIDGVRDVVYTMGHRNPQGIAFEPGTGRVYSVEHGPNVDDEVNLLVPGGNYGWPCFTGDGSSGPAPEVCEGPAGEPADPADYLPAAWASGASTIATSGGGFVSGEQWGGYEGDLFVATLKQQDLRRFDVDGAGALSGPETLFDGTYGRLRAAVPGPGGQLYTTTSNGSDKVIRISPQATSIRRVGGADRYEVAANISESTHPSGVSDVIVATGARYPDALTGSTVGGRLGMPVLLTRVDELPGATRAELERLAPERIWVLGGTASVSTAVFTELGDLASTDVRRLDGATRFEVAAAVSQEWYGTGGTLFIASGEVFADALAAAPAAAISDAPLLLVRRDSIPSATAEQIKRLAPDRIVVLGGTATISRTTYNSLSSFSSASRTRISGRDRYAVARNVAREFWTTSDADVASGEKFADGLTDGASAGFRGVPLLLARKDRVPADTGQQLLALAPTEVTVLGGSATIGRAVYGSLGALAGTP